jgi:hypothetical protein
MLPDVARPVAARRQSAAQEDVMKAVCPNSPEHKRFVTVAHVMQDWLVDEDGDFIAVRDPDVDTSFRPNPGNIWTCDACGAEADVR